MNKKVSPKELVVISGKGGTGKTSITAAFAAIAGNLVVADCDVDAADMHLLMQPTVLKRETFMSGHEASISQDDCLQCGACLAVCRFSAVNMDGNGAGDATFTIDPLACEGCGACVHACPVDAIDFPERVCGEWFVSATPYGLMSHAKLGVAGENSGRLVSAVRKNARDLAEMNALSTILIDGPPGVGCSVIASITGATRVLIVTEPTCSGEHDLKRVLELTKHFGISTYVCINKCDVNPEVANRIEAVATQSGAIITERIPYDRAFTKAQLDAQPIAETATPTNDHIRRVWSVFSNPR